MTSPLVIESPTHGQKSFESEDRVRVVYPDDEQIKSQVHVMMKKLTLQDEKTLHPVFLNDLMTKLAKLDQGQRRTNKKFNNETMVFIPDIVNSEGVQSAVDFIKNAPASKNLTLLTFATTESSIQQLKNLELDILKKGEKTLSIYSLVQTDYDHIKGVS